MNCTAFCRRLVECGCGRCDWSSLGHWRRLQHPWCSYYQWTTWFPVQLFFIWCHQTKDSARRILSTSCCERMFEFRYVFRSRQPFSYCQGAGLCVLRALHCRCSPHRSWPNCWLHTQCKSLGRTILHGCKCFLSPWPPHCKSKPTNQGLYSFLFIIFNFGVLKIWRSFFKILAIFFEFTQKTISTVQKVTKNKTKSTWMSKGS